MFGSPTGEEGTNKREYIWVLVQGYLAGKVVGGTYKNILIPYFFFNFFLARRLYTFRRDSVWSTLGGAGDEEKQQQEESERERRGV